MQTAAFTARIRIKPADEHTSYNYQRIPREREDFSVEGS
jgi:hypothetical protein